MSTVTFHALKTLEPYFTDVKNKVKTFEIRKNDRDFKVGDKLCLQQFCDGKLTGHECWLTITYVLKDCPEYGLSDGFVILGISSSLNFS